MKTAKEIMITVCAQVDGDTEEEWKTILDDTPDMAKACTEMMKRYAEQAIREAAERAIVKCENALKYPGSKLKQTAKVYSVDKQSILNLIKELQ